MRFSAVHISVAIALFAGMSSALPTPLRNNMVRSVGGVDLSARAELDTRGVAGKLDARARRPKPPPDRQQTTDSRDAPPAPPASPAPAVPDEFRQKLDKGVALAHNIITTGRKVIFDIKEGLDTHKANNANAGPQAV